MVRTKEQEPFSGNERTHDLYPYDVDNPFRTERQRLISQGVDPDEFEAAHFRRDMVVMVSMWVAVGIGIFLAGVR